VDVPLLPKTGLPLPGELLADLLSVVREVNAVLDPERLLPTIAQQIRRIVDYRILDIFLPDEQGDLVPAHVEGYDQGLELTRRIRIGEGIVGAAAASHEPVFVPDVSRDPRYIELFPGVVAEMAIPLRHRDRLVGVLNVEGPDVEAFGDDARTALRVLAGHLAVAIDNATLYREARWYAGLLATLYEIGKETASILDLDELLHRVAEIVKRVIDYEMFGILLLEAESGDLVLRKAVRFGGSGEKTRIKVGQGLCGAAAESKQPLLVGDVLNDPRYLRLIPETRSELVIPLVHKDRLIGVFDLESSVLERFNEEHVKVLTPLASQVAVAIENARLVDELRRNELRLARELHIAESVQRGLFPEECPQGRGWEAAAEFRPARELGGDLYDFYELSEAQLGVALGDVSGKGVPAALYGAFASGTVRARAFERRDPRELLRRANRALNRRGVEGFYCTLAYAVFDFSAHTLTIANSGLPLPLLYRAAEGRCQAVDVAGVPLGMFEEAVYDEQTVPVAPGDVLVLYTDGVSEAYDGREAYGRARLAAQIEAHAARPVTDLAETLLADLDAFLKGAEPDDDVTLVVVKVT
jgi:sigma-B regulation protein RsbU (phosphoserine phosphatase)